MIVLEDTEHDLHKFLHTSTGNQFAVFCFFLEPLRKDFDHWVVLHSDQGRHVEDFSQPSVAGLAQTRFASYRGSRALLLRGKPHISNNLFNLAEVGESVGFRQDGLDADVANTRDAAEQVALVLQFGMIVYMLFYLLGDRRSPY